MIEARRVLLSLAIVSLSLLAGCNGPIVGPNPPPPGSGFVYYTTVAPMGVVGYPITATSTLLATLTPSAGNGLSTDLNMAFDANGRLFVLNQALATPSTISVFTPPLTATSNATFILTMPVTGCIYGIAFDASNNMWISNCNTSIYEFTGPFTTTGTLPAPAVTLTSNPFAFGLAFDAGGNLWVALFQPANGIEEFKKPLTGFVSSTPVDHTLTGLTKPEALAFDKAGDLFSAGQAAGEGTAEYLATNLLAGATPNVLDPTGLTAGHLSKQFTFDAAGNLYVADCLKPGNIFVYPTATTAFSATMAPIAYTDANISGNFCAAGIAIH